MTWWVAATLGLALRWRLFPPSSSLLDDPTQTCIQLRNASWICVPDRDLLRDVDPEDSY
jgi:hypothetical protein